MKLQSLFIGTCLAASTMVQARSFDKSNITLAAVAAAPPGWPLPVGNKNWTANSFHLNASVDYAVELIRLARGRGADLIAFPELWFPGYPKSYEEKWLFPYVEEYVANSMEVNSTQWHTLMAAAKEHEIYLSFGYSELDSTFIYMSQALIGPDGEVLINRRKLRPSGSERGLWSDGSLDGLKVVNTSIGRIGMLECWEHLRPAMTFNMQAQIPQIHIGAWPYNENPGAKVGQPFEEAGVAISANQYMSITTGAVTVVPSIGYGFIGQQVNMLAESDSERTASQFDLHGYEPIIYASVNGSSWSNSRQYNVNGEWSWGILQQMEEGFPAYIPKVQGEFVPFRQYDTDVIVRDLRSGNASGEYPASTSVATGVPSATSARFVRKK